MDLLTVPLLPDEENPLISGTDLDITTERLTCLSRKRKCVAPDSIVINNEKTSRGKYKIQKTSTHKGKSENLGQDSTGNVKTLKPFWTEYTKEISEKLWLCTDTDCADLPSSSWNGSSTKLGANSWFSVQMKTNQTPLKNLQKTYAVLQQCSWIGTMACDLPKKGKRGNETKIPAGKARKIKIYPTNDQKQILLKWFGTARWTYNKCLEAIQKEGIERKKKVLRARYLNEDALQNGESKWVLETPYDVRDEAMADLLKSYKTCFIKGKGFKMKYRSKKNPSETLVIRARYFSAKKGAYAQIFRNLRASERLPERIDYDFRIQRTSSNVYYLCIPRPLDVRSESQAPDSSKTVISLDPGIRTFMTGYDPKGLVTEWGKNDKGRIYRLWHHLDDLVSRWSKPNIRHRKRYSMKKAGQRIRNQIRNLVDDLHKKLCKWLCENYRIILIPEFGTLQMIRRELRNINNKTARMMITWSHYRFRQRLLSKVREYPWCKVVLTEESYTSKTCGSCGYVHQLFGKSKVFSCPSCKISIDRDFNGARNILLKYLTKSLASPKGEVSH